MIEWDHLLLYYVNVATSNSLFDTFFPAITDLHKSLLFNLIAYPLFLGLFYWKHAKKSFLIFLGLLLCLGFTDFFGNKLVKKKVERPRPAETSGVIVISRTSAGGYSFTSNHAANMFALATYSSRFIPVLTAPLYTMAFLVAYSRVYNGVHFPADVIVGAILGTLWGLLFSFYMKKILNRPKASL